MRIDLQACGVVSCGDHAQAADNRARRHGRLLTTRVRKTLDLHSNADTLGGGESTRTVLIALFANLVVAMAKSIAAVITGWPRWLPRPRTRGRTPVTKGSC